MRYNVPLIAQQTGMSCWAAGIAMLVSWNRDKLVTGLEVAKKSGYLSQYVSGLDPNDHGILREWGLIATAPMTYTTEGFCKLISDHGPLWVAAAVPGAHIRVVTGFDGDADAAKCALYINDPWERGMTNFRLPNKGSSYSETYLKFVQMNETLGFQELGQPQPVYVAYMSGRPVKC